MNKTNVGMLPSSSVWQYVKSDIELKILDGTFAVGERIPSIRKLADDYGVGQSTAQKILTTLWHEGIIESRRGVGYFVMPYVREKLVAERKKTLEKTLLHAMEEAELIDMDLSSMVERCKEMKSKQKV